MDLAVAPNYRHCPVRSGTLHGRPLKSCDILRLLSLKADYPLRTELEDLVDWIIDHNTSDTQVVLQVFNK
jgi:hypothetical protein